ISPDNLRPSVETSLHNLIEYAYVIHTHPTLVNALMCSNDAEKEVKARFTEQALYVEYTDPGFMLFKKLQERIGAYKKNHGVAPPIIFLQNHGVFVGADTVEEVKKIYESIYSRIREGKVLELPSTEAVGYTSSAYKAVSDHFANRGLIAKAIRCELTDHFTAGTRQFKKISRPFSPDIIVYCKSKYLFLEKGMGTDPIIPVLKQFEQDYGYYPKVILEEGGGLIAVEENEKAIQTVLEVYLDLIKISYLSESFGGPHFMSAEQIRFIDNWEVEHYRRKVAKNAGT
ncbi:MAG: class II aldolase/adducin family protein, partial [Bacteroidales bacterium]|nr:class II aldolase/adducin family protein [Bacteroidales bacterium]